MLFAGGTFGRRANPPADYIVETVAIAKAHGGGVPVKLVWTREEDMRAGFYRPMYLHSFRAALDAWGGSSPGNTGSSGSRSWRAARWR